MMIPWLKIANDTSQVVEYQLEPECAMLSLEPDDWVVLYSSHAKEPPTIQVCNDDRDGRRYFGSIYPGDGDILVKSSGGTIIGEA